MNRGTTYYYCEFRNQNGNNYYLVFDSNGNLIDTIFRCYPSVNDKYIEKLEEKYGANNLKKLDKPPISLILDDIWKQDWKTQMAKVDSLTDYVMTAESEKPKPEFKRFHLTQEGVAKIEGVTWSDGRVTCTWIQKNIKADWSRVGGPPIYQYDTLEEFLLVHPTNAWTFEWIDDRLKVMAVRNLIDNQEVRVQKAISNLNNEFTQLRNRLKEAD